MIDSGKTNELIIYYRVNRSCFKCLYEAGILQSRLCKVADGNDVSGCCSSGCERYRVEINKGRTFAL